VVLLREVGGVDFEPRTLAASRALLEASASERDARAPGDGVPLFLQLLLGSA
jgi:hypothetical protein